MSSVTDLLDARTQAAMALRELAEKLALPRYPTRDEWQEIVEQRRQAQARRKPDELAARRNVRPRNANP